MGVVLLSLFVLILSFAVYGVLAAITNERRSEARNENRMIWLILFFVVGFWLLTPILVEFAQGLLDWKGGAGPFGDQFGAVTSLFSGLAFVGLVWTLFLQRTELSLQRQELESTRKEFELQRFEATLFSLIDLFNAHVSRIMLRSDDGSELAGRAVLEYFSSELRDELKIIVDYDEDGDEVELSVPAGLSIEDQIIQYESDYFISFEADLGPYFRLLYHCIRHIEHSRLAASEKQRYLKIVRSYLGPSELKLLFFNCAARQGKEFKPWVEKYALLKHLNKSARTLNPNLEALFDPAAFSYS